MAETVIITRHPSMVAYLLEIGLIHDVSNVVAHANEEVIRGKHVIGTLPLGLAALAESVTSIPLFTPYEKRGRELTLEEVRRYAGEPKTYKVQLLS